jgi:hypothetical protein
LELEDSKKSFRLNQKPEFKSPFAAMKEDQKRNEEQKKLKEL